MKKLLFFGLLVSLLFSCGDKTPYLVSINNDSEKEVSYTYNEILETLAKGETKVYEVEPYTQVPVNIKDQNEIASIKLKQNHITGNYTFSGADYYILIVTNELPFKVTIRADNYIDNKGEMFLTVDAKKDSEESEEPENPVVEDIKIYTDNPKFTFEPSIVSEHEWKIDDDKKNMTLTVK